MDIEAIRARCAYATPGPWRHWWCGDDHCDCHAVEVPNSPSGVDKMGVRSTKGFDHEQILFSGSDGEGGYSNASNEAEFIAHARQDIPDLLEYIDELEARARHGEAR